MTGLRILLLLSALLTAGCSSSSTPPTALIPPSADLLVPPAEPFLLSLTPKHGATRLWLRDPGTADPQLLITFVTRCAETFGLTGTWGFQCAGVASEPVVDGFSGGAHLLDLSTGRTIEWISTGRWLAEGDAR